jgi:2-polyprenyl-6-methoxyphenol hydroxylase-like FAD-dependent oxidoreductase
VLVGDAAGASDPIWGKGLSLTMRDARVLSDLLQSNDDWDGGCHEYARQHHTYFRVLQALDNSMRELLLDPGLETDTRRQRALALIAQDPTRLPDAIAGPDRPFDEAARRRMFGED